MSLIGALNIGKTALAAHQAAIQVTSNNIANAGNPEYTRQVATLQPGIEISSPLGLMGTGVNVASISRQVDEALEERIRASNSDEQSASVTKQFLDRVQGIFNALGDGNLSSQLADFFNSWSNLANNPSDIGLRQVVIQNGNQIAGTFQSVRGQLLGITTDAATQLKQVAKQANDLANSVAKFNSQISTAEAGGDEASTLRDQRDAALKQLSQLMDIKTQDTGNGMVNVMVGSTPLVLQNQSRGVAVTTEAVNGETEVKLTTLVKQADLEVQGGQLGALMKLTDDPNGAIGQLDKLASNLIFELNKIHSSGQGLSWLSSATATHTAVDKDAAMNSTGADLPFTPQTGTLLVQVRQKSTGLVSSTLVKVDLDGLNGDDTTLQTLADQIEAISGVTASAAGGKLSVSSESTDYEFSFAQDTSGALAAVGINSFFKGTDASDIAIADPIKSRPALLAASANGESGDNTNARKISDLANTAISGLGDVSLNDSYQAMINSIGVAAGAAKTGQQAAQSVRETLDSQRESLSGVSLDEEAINLMREQRAYQAAARVISVVDGLMQTLMQMV